MDRKTTISLENDMEYVINRTELSQNVISFMVFNRMIFLWYLYFRKQIDKCTELKNH